MITRQSGERAFTGLSRLSPLITPTVTRDTSRGLNERGSRSNFDSNWRSRIRFRLVFDPKPRFFPNCGVVHFIRVPCLGGLFLASPSPTGMFPELGAGLWTADADSDALTDALAVPNIHTHAPVTPASAVHKSGTRCEPPLHVSEAIRKKEKK